MQPLVTIVTPLFNRRSLVEETWQSINNQTESNWEWIVVDDGSTDDGTLFISALSEKDQRIKLFYRKDGNKGPSRCRNLGAQRANGNYIMFIDSDDTISEKCIGNRIRFLQENPQLDFAVFPQQIFTISPGDGSGIFNKYFKKTSEYLSSFLRDEHPWQTSAPLWKKTAFLKLGGFNELYSMMEDPELHIRVLLEGLHFDVVKGSPDFFYRISPKTPEQEMQFWSHSIRGRVQFFKDIKNTLDKFGEWDNYKSDVSFAYVKFHKHFLLWRAKDFSKEYYELKHWARSCQLVSVWKIFMIEMYFQLIVNDHYLKNNPLKGFIYRCI